MTSTSIAERTRHLLLGSAAALAIIFNLLLWNQRPGLGSFLFLVLFVVVFVIIAHVSGVARQPLAYLLLIPTIAIGATPVVYNNEFSQYAAPSIAVLLAVIFCVALTVKRSHDSTFTIGGMKPFHSLDVWLRALDASMRDTLSYRHAQFKHPRRIIVGVLCSIPLLIVFGLLFSQADPVFDQWITNAFEALSNLIDIPAFFWRVVQIIIVGSAIAALFYLAADEEHELVARLRSVSPFNVVSTSVVLLLLNVLFGVFVFIQLKYLFGDAQVVLDSGKTFAEVAREGFVYLAVVLIIAGVIIAAVYRAFAHHGHHIAVTALTTLFVALVFVVALSALKRMNLYQDTYGFTVMRLYVEWFIYAVMALLAITCGAIIARWPFRWLVHTGFVLALVVLTVVATLNVDRMIARENIDRYILGQQSLDLEYVAGLSVDALPEIKRLMSAPRDSARLCGKKGVRNGTNYGSWNIDIYKDAQDRIDSWREFNFGAMRAISEKETFVSFDKLLYSCPPVMP